MRDLKETESTLSDTPPARSSAPFTSHISHLASRSRLRHHADYQRVYKAARKQFAKQMAYFFALRTPDAPSDTPGPRIGLTVPKALGNAVARNRIKRRMREAVRRALPLLTVPADVILHPKAAVLTLDFPIIANEVAEIFRAIQKRCASSSSQ